MTSAMYTAFALEQRTGTYYIAQLTSGIDKSPRVLPPGLSVSDWLLQCAPLLYPSMYNIGSCICHNTTWLNNQQHFQLHELAALATQNHKHTNKSLCPPTAAQQNDKKVHHG